MSFRAQQGEESSISFFNLLQIAVPKKFFQSPCRVEAGAPTATLMGLAGTESFRVLAQKRASAFHAG